MVGGRGRRNCIREGLKKKAMNANGDDKTLVLSVPHINESLSCPKSACGK